MQYNKYIYHPSNSASIRNKHTHTHNRSLLYIRTHKYHVTLVLPLALSHSPKFSLVTVLDSNTQGKNMCKLFKQFGQFGNTLNHGVLLLFLCSVPTLEEKEIHTNTQEDSSLFDVQHCSIFAKFVIFSRRTFNFLA